MPTSSFIIGGENSAGRYVFFEVRGCADAREATEKVLGLGFVGVSEVTPEEFGAREFRRIRQDAEILST